MGNPLMIEVKNYAIEVKNYAKPQKMIIN